MGRQRIGRPERRQQLLDAAEAAFATHAYETVQMDGIARDAKVSRALLYQHFASKRDLFAEVYRRAADRLLEATVLDDRRPLLDQVADGLDVHIDYFLANRQAVLAANRTLAGDPVIATIISDELSVLRERVVSVAQVGPQDQALLGDVLMGWLVFVRVLCVEWLSEQGYSRDVLRDVCTASLAGALSTIHGSSAVVDGEQT